MRTTLGFVVRLPNDALHGLAVVADRGLGLKRVAVRNAQTAVECDPINARSRAEAATAIAVHAAVIRERSLQLA
jgi:hypothetical protein